MFGDRFNIDADDALAGWDRFGRVVDLAWRTVGTTSSGDDDGLVRIRHGYDQASNRLWREDGAASGAGVNIDEYYDYDALNRLKDFKRGDLDASHAIDSMHYREQWLLDQAGNWSGYFVDEGGDASYELIQTRTHTKANEIDVIGAMTGTVWDDPAHDRSGNMTELPQPDAPTDHYHARYDAWNRLVEVLAANDTTVIAEYVYDGRNFRTVKKTYTDDALDETRHFYYNNQWQCLEERVDEETRPDVQYVWGARYIDDLILRDRDADASSLTGNLGGTSSGLEERLYALQDANFNVVALSDVSGDILQRHMYDAYGKLTTLDPDFTSYTGTDLAWDYTYTTRRLDAETGLMYYRNRYYDTRLGRFVTRDPIGYSDGIAVYRYVKNAPTNHRDPSGLQAGAGPTFPGDAMWPDSGGLVRPKCGRCGPEIGPHLRTLHRKMHQEFVKVLTADPQKAFNACANLPSPIGWEISELAWDKEKFSSNGCGTGDCFGTVEVFGSCHWASEVNYFMFGLANHLCRMAIFNIPGLEPILPGDKGILWTEGFAVAFVRLWRSITFWYGDGTTLGRVAWTRAGYHGRTNVTPARPGSKYCAKCGKPYTGSLHAYFGNVFVNQAISTSVSQSDAEG